MIVPDTTYRINLCNLNVTPAVLASIATKLEEGLPVLIENAAIPMHGPGVAAMLIGYRIKGAELIDMLESK